MLSAVKDRPEVSESVAHRRDEQQSETKARQPQVTDGGVLEFARALGSGLEGDGGAADLAGECTPAGLQTRGTGLIWSQIGLLSVLACCLLHAYQGDVAVQSFSGHCGPDGMLLGSCPNVRQRC